MANFNADDFYLRLLFNVHYGDEVVCVHCGKRANFYRIRRRKSYACAHCGYHLAPTVGTLFYKSTTPLSKWFKAIELYAASEGQVSARGIARELKVTYKCAWRIRQRLKGLR